MGILPSSLSWSLLALAYQSQGKKTHLSFAPDPITSRPPGPLQSMCVRYPFWRQSPPVSPRCLIFTTIIGRNMSAARERRTRRRRTKRSRYETLLNSAHVESDQTWG